MNKIEKRFLKALLSITVGLIITILSGGLSWWLTADLIMGGIDNFQNHGFIMMLSVIFIGWPALWIILGMLMVYAIWKTTGIFSTFVNEMFSSIWDD